MEKYGIAINGSKNPAGETVLVDSQDICP